MKLLSNYLASSDHPENLHFYYIAGHNNFHMLQAEEILLESKLHFDAMDNPLYR
jgi:hypothetical protein